MRDLGVEITCVGVCQMTVKLHRIQRLPLTSRTNSPKERLMHTASVHKAVQ
jgi:hypothetical protein